MLKYSVKITENDFKDTHLIWREKYVAPDLSFISGVTDSSFHLEKFSQLPAFNSYTNQSSILDIETEIVTRLGYVIAKEKEYPIHSVTHSGKTYNYVFINGKYFYEDGGSGYTITNWQVERYKKRNGEYVPIIEERDVSSTKTTNDDGIDVIKLDTVYWIEDGFVNIDGVQYIFDKNEIQSGGTQGCIKFTDDGTNIEKVTKCKSMYYMPYTSITQIHDVCKFTATCETDRAIMTNNVDYSEYFYYVNYKDHYCSIIIDNGDFKCEIPNNMLEPNGVPSAVTSFDVYYVSTEDGAEEYNEEKLKISASGGIYDISSLNDIDAFVYVPDNENTHNDLHRFHVQSDYRTTNLSKQLMIYLTRDVEQFSIGDILTFYNTLENETYIDIEKDDNGMFILYNGKRYNVKPNLFDKAVIGDEKYDIEYDDLDNVNAYVIINGERVPMKRVKDEGGSGETLVRYGKVIDENGKVVSSTTKVVYYSGVTINDVNYEIDDATAISGISKAIVEGGNKIKLRIVDIKGSSLLICEPYINLNEFTPEYVLNKQYALTSEIVENKEAYGLMLPNNLFGNMPITEDLAFLYTDNPSSSDDYYDLLDDLVIETKNGYINIPLTFGTTTSNNIVQSDLIEKEFVDKERKSHINNIVDMEKDVYVPKYISGGSYSGSSTEFLPIFKINVNLHFRTRNMTNWKVNEGYNDVSISGTADNWFITDYEPYKTIIESGLTNDINKLMMETSDLLYLLDFSDDDVYYQKSRLAKSFLRISIYDSTDPQTQSLLATSCVFVNEHDLYKKYIDHSRRGINKFLVLYGDNFKETNKIKTRTELFTPLSNKESDKCGDGTVKYDKNWYSGRCENQTDPFYDFTHVKDKNGNTTRKNMNGICIDFEEKNRLSSRLVVDNKYDTDTSSEGFYIYMFRQYSQNLHPKPIYMKIEYNHAGIGKTIPFFIPMVFDDKNNPTSAMTFINDMENLKKGIPLSQVYKQSYIPLDAVYDFKNKEYAYVFDNRYIGNIEDGVLNLNLFEMKISSDDEKDTENNIS